MKVGSSYIAHDASIITAMNSIPATTLTFSSGGNTAKTVDLSVESSDLTVDSDGTFVAPKFEFLIEIEAADSTTIATLGLDVTLKNPCRVATISMQPSILGMTASAEILYDITDSRRSV